MVLNFSGWLAGWLSEYKGGDGKGVGGGGGGGSN